MISRDPASDRSSAIFICTLHLLRLTSQTICKHVPSTLMAMTRNLRPIENYEVASRPVPYEIKRMPCILYESCVSVIRTVPQASIRQKRSNITEDHEGALRSLETAHSIIHTLSDRVNDNTRNTRLINRPEGKYEGFHRARQRRARHNAE